MEILDSFSKTEIDFFISLYNNTEQWLTENCQTEILPKPLTNSEELSMINNVYLD